MVYTFVGNVQNRLNFGLHPMDYDDASPGSDQPVEAMFGMVGGPTAAASATASPSGSPSPESDYIVAAIGEGWA